jgi:hypothetical protein
MHIQPEKFTTLRSHPYTLKKTWTLIENEMNTYPNLGEADPGGLGACPQKRAASII